MNPGSAHTAHTEHTAHTARIAIIGGGLSGLYAAWRLAQLGIHDHVLLEARDRLGGRILSADVSTQGQAAAAAIDRFDLGPSWFWPGYQPQLDALVSALGLQRFEQFEQGDMVVERSAAQPPLRTHGYRSEPASMRLAGGMQALVEALHGPLQASRVLCGHAVRELRLAATHVEVVASSPAGETVLWQVQHVLLALPPRLAVHAIRFAPALPQALAHAWRTTETWMAPHAKYVAIYPTPFWREQGLSGEARSAMGPMVEIHDASAPGGHAALFGFIGVPVQARRSVDEAVLRAHCRAQMARLFGPQAQVPIAEALKDWALDAHTATEADWSGSGQHPAPPATGPDTGPWHGRLAGIGSEWSLAYPGYLAGAVEAAERGVQAWRSVQPQEHQA